MNERPDDIADPLLSARIKASLGADRAPTHLVHRLEDLARAGARPVPPPRPAWPLPGDLPQWAGVALVASLLFGSARTLGIAQILSDLVRHAGDTAGPAAGGSSMAIALTAVGLLLAALETIRRSAGRR